MENSANDFTAIVMGVHLIRSYSSKAIDVHLTYFKKPASSKDQFTYRLLPYRSHLLITS